MSATTARVTTRTPVLLLMVLGLLLGPVATMTPAALADSGMESQFVSQINSARASAGLPALSTSGDLTSVARSWSATMADEGKLYHRPGLGSAVSNWQLVGENVGQGPSVSALHSAFMGSPGHKANILNDRYTQVGVGVVVKDGTIWVTQVFRQPAGAPAPKAEPKPKPEPKAETKPAPEPAPKPQSSSSSGSSGSSNGTAPASTPAPQPDPEPEPEPEPEPHEVVERPLPMDRVTLMLARLEATDLGSGMGSILATDA
jgi:uncharacterized protein YkwD